jgi:hypothetical protein
MDKTLFDINDLLSGYLNQLRVEAKYFSNQIEHNGEKGHLNETHFRAILRRFLPKRFGIATGFIVSTNGGQLSPQCDIIIYDAINNAPLYESEAFSVFPIEMVYAVIEVKTNLSNSRKNVGGEVGNFTELDDCLWKCSCIRHMAQEEVSEEDWKRVKPPEAYPLQERGVYKKIFKGYIRHQVDEKGNAFTFEIYNGLPPRFFIFAYRGHANPETLRKRFAAATERYPDAHIHGLCVLGDGTGQYTKHLPFRNPSERAGDVLCDGGFAQFLFSMPSSLDSMLFPFPERSGNGFDLVNLDRYRFLKQRIEQGETSVVQK